MSMMTIKELKRIIKDLPDQTRICCVCCETGDHKMLTGGYIDKIPVLDEDENPDDTESLEKEEFFVFEEEEFEDL